MDFESLERPPGHAFISYVREDTERVDRLAQLLTDAGIRVWRDTENLWPGQDWKIQIREAITSGTLAFVACFSDSSERRATTYQNEEIILAVEQMRLRPPGRSWLIPVRFSECAIPEYDLGTGRTLRSLQRVDLFDGVWEPKSTRLVAAIVTILAADGGAPAAHNQSGPVASSVAAQLKATLLAPERQIELEDLVGDVLTKVRAGLTDDMVFPATMPQLANDLEGIRYIAKQAYKYAETVGPLIDLLVLGCAYGRPEHNLLWARSVQNIANANRVRSGSTALINLQRLPLALAIYAASIAAVHRQNFGALRAVTVDGKFKNEYGERNPLIGAIHPWELFEHAEPAASLIAYEAEDKTKTDDELHDMQTRRAGMRLTPVSDYLHAQLRQALTLLVLDDDDYTETFDLTEIYLGLIATHEATKARAVGRRIHPWYGSFTWRNRHSQSYLEERVRDEIVRAGDDWTALQVGLFDGSAEHAAAAATTFAEESALIRNRPW